MKSLQLFLLFSCFVGAAFCVVRTIDPFQSTTVAIQVAGDSTATVVASATLDNTILGGERDLFLIGSGGGGKNAITQAYVDSTAGQYFCNNDNAAKATAVVQIDGVDGGSSTLQFTLNADISGSASGFIVSAFADLAGGSFTINAYTNSASNKCSFTQNILGGGTLTDYPIALNAPGFTTGCNWHDIDALELVINPVVQIDFKIEKWELNADTIFGTIFGDCDCNNVQDVGENGVQGVSVTATPSLACSSQVVKTTTSTATGSYVINGLTPSCTYRVTIDTVLGKCAGAPAFTDVDLNIANTASFGVVTEGNLVAPADTSRSCTQKNNIPTSDTGAATLVGSCGGGQTGTITFTDSTVNGCTSVVTRTFRYQGQSAQQTITLTDTGIGPTITCPSDKSVACDASTDPSATGTATAVDDCTSTGNIDITFTDSETTGCNLQVCGETTTITRTWRADDGCNPSTSCVQTIIVNACTGTPKPTVCPTAKPHPSCRPRPVSSEETNSATTHEVVVDRESAAATVAVSFILVVASLLAIL